MKEKYEEMIYDGCDYWPQTYLSGLTDVKTKNGGRKIYRDAPASLYASLKAAAGRWPERSCIVDEDGTVYTYAEFLGLADRFSNYLHEKKGVRAGMHVGLLLYNTVEFFVAVYALNRLRAVIVPFSTKYKWEEVSSLMDKADLSGVIYHIHYEGYLGEEKEGYFQVCMDVKNIRETKENPCLPSGDPMDDAVLMFTSGTTSQSKGVVLKNYNLVHAILVYQKIFGISCEDKTVLPVPAYHITGMIAVGGLFLHCGGCVWLHKFFDAGRVLDEMEKQQLTFFHASPTVFTMLLEELEKKDRKLSLRILACGSGNMPVRKISGLKKKVPGAAFRTVYGLTETSSPGTILPEAAEECFYKGTAGCPVPGMYFKICDEEGRALPPLGIGTIMVKGTNVTDGYYRLDQDLIRDGWLDTGDLGYFNEEGYLFVVDRKKDMINRGGEKICSYDVENLLYEIPGIRDAAVVGIPDEKYGEVPAAMAVPADGFVLTEEEIRERLKLHLAKFQIPVKILFVEALPLTANMKTDKRKIRQILEASAGQNMH